MKRNSGPKAHSPHSLKSGEWHSWLKLDIRKFGFGKDKFYFIYTKIKVIQNPLIRTLDMSPLSEEPQGVLTLGPATYTVNLREKCLFLFPTHHLYLQQIPNIMSSTGIQFHFFTESDYISGRWSYSPHRWDRCT